MTYKGMDVLETIKRVSLDIYKAILDFLKERPISFTLQLMKEFKILRPYPLYFSCFPSTHGIFGILVAQVSF